MAVPQLVSINRTALDARNITFTDWLRKENTLYISSQARKYAKAPENSPWMPSKLSYKLYTKEISQADFDDQYESYVRREMWNKLPTLADKELGCWCSESEQSQCHGRILLRLYREMTKQ